MAAVPLRPSTSLSLHQIRFLHQQLRRRCGQCSNSSSLSLHASSRRAYARAADSGSGSSSSKPRTLEKPARFNPPSHGSRRARPAPPRNYPGPRPSEEEAAVAKTRRYPNMMPPEGSFMHWFLTSKGLHLWITLSVLTSCAGYAMWLSFITTTTFRNELPESSDFLSQPFGSIRRSFRVYRKHVEHESAKVAERRAMKAEDAKKRHEFLRAHGVEPGFLTGTWMDKFGTIEGDKIKEEMRARKEAERQAAAVAAVAADGEGQEQVVQMEQPQPPRERKKVKRWFGIWE